MLKIEDLDLNAEMAFDLQIDTGLIAIIIAVAVLVIVLLLVGLFLCVRGCIRRSEKVAHHVTTRGTVPSGIVPSYLAGLPTAPQSVIAPSYIAPSVAPSVVESFYTRRTDLSIKEDCLCENSSGYTSLSFTKPRTLRKFSKPTEGESHDFIENYA